MAVNSSGKTFSSRGKEPTREQIKEAFKETIERWEKIVGSPKFFHDSHCSLCRLQPGCSSGCPIRLYAGRSECHATPYMDFIRDETPANALAELNFLRKVYIWWMEKEANKIFKKHGIGVVRARKEEKKEEWEDVAEELSAEVYNRTDGFAVDVYHNDLNVALIDADGIFLRLGNEIHRIYKASIKGKGYRILKKV